MYTPKQLLEKANAKYNLTNKLVRTFLRLAYHYEAIEVSSYPYEEDTNLHLEISGDMNECSNGLLWETGRLVRDGIIGNNYHR